MNKTKIMRGSRGISTRWEWYGYNGILKPIKYKHWYKKTRYKEYKARCYSWFCETYNKYLYATNVQKLVNGRYIGVLHSSMNDKPSKKKELKKLCKDMPKLLELLESVKQ